MDTSVLQCYPTLFAIATDILDILGDMVWERIKLKAEFTEDGTRIFSLPGITDISPSASFVFFTKQYSLSYS